MRTLLLAILGMSLSGCANFNTSTKGFWLPKGEGLAMDAKQRVIYGKDKLSDPTVYCAEPSPDALSALGASLSGSGTGTSGATGSLAFGSSEAAAMIGLRTQSIQLLRDLNYRICESYGNNAIHSPDVAALLRRGQSTMMGLMAIEQLTGPVVAHQVTLSAAVNAGKTAPNAQDLNAAQGVLDQKVAAVTQAETAYKASQAELSNKEKRRNELSDQLNTHLGAEPTDASKTAEQEAWEAKKKELEGQVKTAQEEVTKANEKLTTDGDTLRVARESQRQAELSLNAIRNGSVSAAAATTADIELMSRQASVMTQNLVAGVSGIVSQVNYSFIVDNCMSLFGSLSQNQQLLNSLLGAADKKAPTIQGLEAVVGMCVALVTSSKDQLIKTLSTPITTVPTPAPAPRPGAGGG